MLFRSSKCAAHRSPAHFDLRSDPGESPRVSLEFEWDPRKAAANLKRHPGVSFTEAATAFADPMSITVADPDHSGDEDRCILIGRSRVARLLVVVHVERGEKIRIISARKANKTETKVYAGET